MELINYTLLIFIALLALKATIHYSTIFATFINNDKLLYDIRTEKLRGFINSIIGFLLYSIFYNIDDLHISITILRVILTLALLIALSITWTRQFEIKTNSKYVSTSSIQIEIKEKPLKISKFYIERAREINRQCNYHGLFTTDDDNFLKFLKGKEHERIQFYGSMKELYFFLSILDDSFFNYDDFTIEKMTQVNKHFKNKNGSNFSINKSNFTKARKLEVEKKADRVLDIFKGL